MAKNELLREEVAVYDALKAWSDMKLALGEEPKPLGDKR